MIRQTTGEIGNDDIIQAVRHHLMKAFASATGGEAVTINRYCVLSPDRPYESAGIDRFASLATAELKDSTGLDIKVGYNLSAVETILKNYFRETQGQELKSLSPVIDSGINDRGPDGPQTFAGFRCQL